MADNRDIFINNDYLKSILMNDNLKNKIANISAIVFNPIIWASLIFIIITFYYTGLSTDFLIISSICILFVSIIPLIVVRIWSNYKKTDMDLYHKEDRDIPLLISTLSCLIATIILYLVTNIMGVVVVMFAYFCNMLLIFLITYKWKISIHSISVSSSIPFLIYLFGYPANLFLILLILSMWSRLHLKKHTFAQVVAGASLGLILSTLIIVLALKFNFQI